MANFFAALLLVLHRICWQDLRERRLLVLQTVDSILVPLPTSFAAACSS